MFRSRKQQLDPAAREEKEAQAVLQLRALMQCPEGVAAAQQLVQGGELASAADAASDLYLRRWLFAREWDVAHTYACMLKHAGWRAHVHPHGFIDETHIAGPLERETIFLQGTDSLGRALAIVRVRDHVADKKGLKEMKLFTCYVMNAMVALCDPATNPRGRTVSMFDMTGASYANMDVAAMKMILGLLNLHYVERLDLLIFYNPPSVFWSIWNTLKGLLPPETRKKLVVVDPAELDELLAVVPRDVLPREYGGHAEPLPLREAVRRFKLPPWPHLPELRGSGSGAAASAPPSVGDSEDEMWEDAQEEWAAGHDGGDGSLAAAAADRKAAAAPVRVVASIAEATPLRPV